jgi:hypothetical protein
VLCNRLRLPVIVDCRSTSLAVSETRKLVGLHNTDLDEGECANTDARVLPLFILNG